MKHWLIYLASNHVTEADLNLPTPDLTQDTFTSALQIVFGFAGGVALIMVAIGAFQFVISTGNPQATAKAKNTIIYALIGLAVSLSAFMIVTFVIGRI